MEETTYPGVLLGYRGWWWSPTRETLQGITTFGSIAPWKPGGVTTEARCPMLDAGAHGEDKVAPAFACYCGLYAHSSLYAALDNPLIAARRSFEFLHHMVVGAALFWGRVIRHENDAFFRAQYGLPIALLRTKESVDYDKIAQVYGVRIFAAEKDLIAYAEAVRDEYSLWS